MTTTNQLSFVGGEVAPSVYGRTDQAKYQTGLKTCKNAFIARHGGAYNRPGTKYVGRNQNSANTTRLIPFILTSDIAYVLEFGDLTMRVIKNGAYVIDSTIAITNVQQTNPCLVDATAHGLSVGDEIYIINTGGMLELNGRNYKVKTVVSPNQIAISDLDGVDINATSFSAWSASGNIYRLYKTVSPFAVAAIARIQYAQAGKILTLVHNDYDIRELLWVSDSNWTFSTVTIGPTIGAGVVFSITGTAGAATLVYHATAVSSTTDEEGLAGFLSQGALTAPALGSPVTVTLTGVSGAGYYNVYRELNGIPGFVGSVIHSGAITFVDIGYTPDVQDTPPLARNPFSGAGNRPAAVSYFQQRRFFANTLNNPETVYGSKVGLPKNFCISTPLQDDDAITFTPSSRQLNAIRHMRDLGKFVIFTNSGEWVVGGDSSGTVTPTQINLKQETKYGSSTVMPQDIGGGTLYIQDRGVIVRDISFQFEDDGYRGNDLTVFAAHLFDGFSIVDATYQQNPHSIIWIVRNDGMLIGGTYIKEHRILAWHKHDLGGLVENVCVIPEGPEDILYICVKRTINSASVRHIERLHTRYVSNIDDAIFMDAASTYDGRNLTATTITITGTTFDQTSQCTLTASAGIFKTTDVGDAYRFRNAAGDEVWIAIENYTSPTVLLGRPDATIAVALRNTPITLWARGDNVIGGLWYLEGKAVSALADGTVVANPNDANIGVVTVTNGQITLDDDYAVIQVGLPYISDLKTLDPESGRGETLADNKLINNKVTLTVESSRGIWAGAQEPASDAPTVVTGLSELTVRENEEYRSPINLVTGKVDIVFDGSWESQGSVFIRQIDPLPFAILAIASAGYIPLER